MPEEKTQDPQTDQPADKAADKGADAAKSADLRLEAVFEVRNVRRSWAGPPPNLEMGDHRAPDLEVADLVPVVGGRLGKPGDGVDGIVVLGAATLYVENTGDQPRLPEGQRLALRLTGVALT